MMLMQHRNRKPFVRIMSVMVTMIMMVVVIMIGRSRDDVLQGVDAAGCNFALPPSVPSNLVWFVGNSYTVQSDCSPHNSGWLWSVCLPSDQSITCSYKLIWGPADS